MARREEELLAFNDLYARAAAGLPAVNQPAASTAGTNPYVLPAGRQGGPAPFPAIAAPRPAPKPVAVQPGVTHVGRAGMPTQTTRAGYGRGAATTPPSAPNVPLAAITNAEARPVNTTQALPYFGESPRENYVEQAGTGVANAPAASAPTLYRQTSRGALNETAPGTAVISGRFPGESKRTTRSYTKEGLADAAKRLNVVPGLFSGISLASDEALSKARFAAAKRGDFAAVERSYADTPEKKAAYDQQAAETKILNAVGRAPLSQLPQVGQAVSSIQAGRTEAALGGLKLEEGEAAAQTLKAKRALYEKLGALDPADTKGRTAIIDQLLAYEGKVQTQQKQSPFQQVKAFDEYGQPVASTRTFDPNSGQYSQPQAGGGPQAAQPDGVYEMPGIGKVTVRDGIARDDKGNILQ